LILILLKTWREAHDYCCGIGMYLAQINNSAERDFVMANSGILITPYVRNIAFNPL